MNKFKGTFHAITQEQLDGAFSKNKEYSKSEIENLDTSIQNVWDRIFPFLAQYNAIEHVPALEVPTVFVQGTFDMATPTELARSYFDSLHTIQGKQWVEFTNSAHFPFYEEPSKFLELLR